MTHFPKNQICKHLLHGRRLPASWPNSAWLKINDKLSFITNKQITYFIFMLLALLSGTLTG